MIRKKPKSIEDIPERNRIGQRLKNRRDELGLKMHTVARRAGLSHCAVIHKYENGTRMPSIVTAIALAEALETTLDSLFGKLPEPGKSKADGDRVRHVAEVDHVFGRRRCVVWAIGEPKDRYAKDELLWVERGEDLYALSSPSCKAKAIMYREDYLSGDRL